MLTIAQARAKKVEAVAAWEAARVAKPYDRKAIEVAFDGQLDARYEYAVVAVDATVSAAEGMGHGQMTRADLCAALDAVTGSKLSYGDAILLAIERQQLYGGAKNLMRWDFRARAADGSHRAMSQEMYLRAMKVLFAYTLRREDTGAMCPPYRLRKTSLGLVEDVDASTGAVQTDADYRRRIRHTGIAYAS